jgi:hypothetical protein
VADLVITNTAVVAADSAVKESGLAGETIAAGKAVYKSPTSKKWMLADSNSATAAAKTAGGIALNGASLNQPVTVAKAGDITMNAVLTAGSGFYLSDTPGGICPDADVGAGENVCQIGIAKSTTVLSVRIVAPGVSR